MGQIANRMLMDAILRLKERLKSKKEAEKAEADKKNGDRRK